MPVNSRRSHRIWSRGDVIKGAGLALVLIAAAAVASIYGPGWVGFIQSRVDPERVALREALRTPAMADLRSGYASRHYKPIWIVRKRAGPEAAEFIVRLKASRQDGLDPERYRADELADLLPTTASASRADRAAVEVLLSRAYADYVFDLHNPLDGADMAYTDPQLRPFRPPAQAVVEALARARTPGPAIARASRMNPLYQRYREALGRPSADPATERLLRINLERMRALPVDLGPRFVLVDAASGRLWLYENGTAVDSMKVIVGTPQEPTPMMVGAIRYAVFNPSWNVPPDLTRKTYAPRMRADPSTLADLGMDVWTDHTRSARKLNPILVNWGAVAHGATSVWLRQRPGPHNSMGAVKFMLPNELGIYLHDTPNKELFDRDERAFSAGCVRVEDYRRLARFLYRGQEVGPRGTAPDQRINLPAPVPVYITYLTATPLGGTVTTTRDVYDRDKVLAEQLQKDGRLTAPPGEGASRSGLRRLSLIEVAN
jgi:L,D-transpeptidase YcbB